jgi:rfaE bifunctional protein kinase chain/domain
MGVIGNDYHGNILKETMINENVDVSYLFVDEARQTTTKTRVLGCSTQSVTQQIIRVDREDKMPISGVVEARMIDTMRKVIKDYDGILLSDYGIGMMTPDIISEATKLANENKKVVVVDAQDDLQRFKNVTMLTPNQPDAEKTIGYKIKDKETLLKGGQELLDMTMADSVLITRGGEGMVLFERNGNITEIPAFNRTEVFDVTGAGDTVAGTVVLGLCSGGTGAEAAILGNLAASLVVRKFGAATTTQDELIRNLEGLNLDNIRNLSFNHC